MFTSKRFTNLRGLALLVALSAGLATAACDHDDVPAVAPARAGDGAAAAVPDAAVDAGAVVGPDASLEADGAAAADAAIASDAPNPLYAIASLTFNDKGSTTYLNFLDSLDVQPKVELKTAREFPGYSPTDAIGGKVIVADGETPRLTRYDITGDRGEAHKWVQEATISFTNITSKPLESFYATGPATGLVPFDTINHVAWNPSEFVIGAETGVPATIPLVRDGLKVQRGYSFLLRGTTVFQPYYFAREDYQKYTQLSQVSVIDSVTNRVTGVLDIPCPHLHIASQDDAGNITFSNGQGSIGAAVLDQTQPRNCFAQVKAGAQSFDPANVVYFKDLTDGREGSNFFYIDDKVAIFNVYHAERDNIGPATEYKAIDFSTNYHLWTLDLATMKAHIMEGIDFAGGQVVAFRIDKRTFLTIPAGDYSSTAVWEVLPSGRAEKRFDVQSWAFKMFRVR
jgi:hypothetical protein